MKAADFHDLSSFGLDGRNAVVTGASRGLGRGIAQTLRALGANVLGTSRSTDGADRIAEMLGGAETAALLDITNTADLGAAVDRLFDQLGGTVDILVNNAGVNHPAPAVDVTEAQWDAVLDSNLKGTFFLTQAFARRWIDATRAAAVINIGSQAGTVGIEERAAYCASKGGLDQLTKVLAIEFGRHGIRVNTVAPTFVRTELTASTLSRPDWARTLLDRIPLGRFGDVRDVAGTVGFLASDAAALITGHTLLVDGGYTAW